MKSAEVASLVEDFVLSSPLNRVTEAGLESIYDAPLCGFASADDALFLKLQEDSVIGVHHLLPREWLPQAKSVISYFLPFSKNIREANRQAGMPAAEWVYARIEGETLNDALRQCLVDAVTKSGGTALVPVFDSRFALVDRRSNWSERHVAYIAGLGTFSLSKSLITAKGCAGRFGSVIVSLPLKATLRNYSGFDAYCNMCGACIKRCPCGAIGAEGKNTALCADYIDNKIKPLFQPRYGCGKCQTAVPCERGLPE